MRFRQATGFLAVAVLATTFVFLGSGAASADSSNPTTTTALTLSANVIAPGDPVTLTATVTGTGNPTGTVQFSSDGSSPIGTPVTLTPVAGSSTDSQASLTTTSLTSVGTHTISATFKSSSLSNFFNSTSAGKTLIVATTPVHSTVTTLVSNPAGTVPYDQPVTFTAHVAENDGGTFIPTGTVTFNDITSDPSNPIPLGSATVDASGNATVVSTGFLSNPHVISASYSGDGSNQASATSISVQVAPQQSNQLATTTTTVSLSPSEITVGDSTTISAQVSPAPTQGELVTFTANGNAIGQAPVDGNGKATLSPISNWGDGSYDIQASYGGDDVDLQSAGDATLTVDAEVSLAVPTTTTLTVTPAPITATQTTTLFAHVVQSNGTVLPPQGEMVTFTANGTSMGEAPLDVNGNASLVVSGWTEGTYDVEASYGGDTFDAASSDDFNLTVTAERMGPPAPLTVTGPSLSMTYGSAVPTLPDAFYNGFVEGDTEASLSTSATCTTTATSSSPAGAYPVTCTGATDVNYAISYADGTVTVNPAGLTVTAQATSSMTYGGTVPAFAAPTYSGFVNHDTKASLTSLATCTTAATSSSPVGSYPVTCSGASGPNYTVTYVAGNLNVNKAPLTVTAPTTATMTFGASVPTLTPTYSSFLNGDTAASLTSPPVCLTTATSASPVGSYPVTCSSAAGANYTFTYVASTLSVTKAPLTVTGPSPSMTYDGTVPTIGAPGYSGFVNGNTTASLTSLATCTATVTKTSPAGSYPVTCSGAAGANYAITYVPGHLIVNPAVLTVTGSATPTMTYGGSVPAIPAPAYAGFVNGETTASLTTLATCGTTATSSSPVGSYPVNCTGAAAANYTFNYVAGHVTVNKAALTVTAPAAATMTFGSSVPALTPSYAGFVNGDTAASLSTLPNCTTTATSSSAVGSYPVTCSAAASPNYTFTYVAGHLAVTQVTLTVTGASPSMTYGGTVPTIPAPTYSGFVNGNTTATLTKLATCTTTATKTSPAGSYPVTCSGATGANYTFVYVAGSLTVNPAVLTVTGPAATMTYGGTVPTIGAPSYSGFVNGDTVASLSTTPTCITTATSGSAAGSYPVTCSGAAAANYTFTYTSGHLTVNPAALTVTGPSSSMLYASPLPTLPPATYSGFVNGDTSAALTSLANCTTTATSSSPVGSYPVSCSGAAAPNYTFAYVAGHFSVTPSALTVIAPAAASMTYGGTVPTLTPTYAGFLNGDTAASLGTRPTCTAAATSASPVGTYPVTCSGAAGANYTFSYVAGQITVGPAALTVTAPSPSMVLNAAVPTLIPTYSGFLNGDTAASLTTQPICTTAATSSSPLGSYPVTCSGAAAANYTISYVAGSLTVTPAGTPTTLVYTGPTNASYGNPVILSATLTTGTTPVSGANVTLSLGSQSCSAVTTSAGRAICLVILSQPAGTYPVGATFAATSVYQASNATSTFTVTPQATNIYAFFSGPAATGDQVTLTAWLAQNLIIPVPNETVTLSLGSQSCTAVTGFLGLAQCTVTVAGPLGPTTANAVFAGDSSYGASSDSNSALIYAYAPSGSAFVIGDRSTSGTVTFWGSQWSKANSLSGGAAPSTFKGFALSPAAPDVGDKWSTGSNASPAPPAGPLPTYMAVVVTSSAGKSGSSITGNVANIAIVKTNAGYSPSGTGTGTVVATLD